MFERSRATIAAMFFVGLHDCGSVLRLQFSGFGSYIKAMSSENITSIKYPKIRKMRSTDHEIHVFDSSSGLYER
jgi:hypothetical protein